VNPVHPSDKIYELCVHGKHLKADSHNHHLLKPSEIQDVFAMDIWLLHLLRFCLSLDAEGNMFLQNWIEVHHK